MRNGHDRRPETRQICSSKVALLKFLWTVCSTTQNTVESMMRGMMSTARLGGAETACRVGVLCADLMNTCPRGSITA